MLRLEPGAVPPLDVDAVEVRRWEPFGLGDRLPFFGMWYSVPPAETSPRDCHPEVELSVVVNGTAHVETGDTITEVPCGEAFLLDSNEAHVVHNRSTDTTLTIVSVYWWPSAAAAASTLNEANAARAAEPAGAAR